MSAKAIKLLDLSPNFYQTRARSLLITVDDEDRVANNLLQIWKLRFGQKTFIQTLSTRLCQDFEIEVKARFEAGVWTVFSADVL